MFVPEPQLCTDNGAMIASVGVDRMLSGVPGDGLVVDGSFEI